MTLHNGTVNAIGQLGMKIPRKHR